MKEILKRLIKKLPIAFTINQRYDRQTKKVIEKICEPGSHCIDVGCHKGEIMDMMLKAAPNGPHYAFEPIPALFDKLKQKYRSAPCILFQLAASNNKSEASFNYVLSNPAYSGLLKRRYDRPHEEDTTITVQTDTIDNLVPQEMPVALIKIDVEGGELLVLEGAINTLQRWKPVVLFEHGLGASDRYGSTPEKLFDLFASCGLKVSLLEYWLAGKKSLTLAEFREQYDRTLNFFFIAYP